MKKKQIGVLPYASASTISSSQFRFNLYKTNEETNKLYFDIENGTQIVYKDAFIYLQQHIHTHLHLHLRQPTQFHSAIIKPNF